MPVSRGNIRLDNEHPLADLSTIALAANEKTLQAVTITAGPKLIENKIDKLVYNAERDISSQTGVATDILKNGTGLEFGRWALAKRLKRTKERIKGILFKGFKLSRKVKYCAERMTC